MPRAHDLEKRQHLFAHGILQPLPPARVGIFGSGTPRDITTEVVVAEKQIEARWSTRPVFHPQVIERPDSEYPDVAPPSYEASAAGVAAAGAAAGSSTGKSSAIKVPPPLPARTSAATTSTAVPPPLPPRHDVKLDAETSMPGAL